MVALYHISLVCDDYRAVCFSYLISHSRKRKMVSWYTMATMSSLAALWAVDMTRGLQSLGCAIQHAVHPKNYAHC